MSDMDKLQEALTALQTTVTGLQSTVTQDQRNLNISWIILCSKRPALFCLIVILCFVWGVCGGERGQVLLKGL